MANDTPTGWQTVEHSPETGCYSTTYDHNRNPASVAVFAAMLRLLESDVDDLDRLGEATAIEPEALDALFAPTPSGARGSGRVVFVYLDHTVRVFSSGRIEIQPSDTVE